MYRLATSCERSKTFEALGIIWDSHADQFKFDKLINYAEGLSLAKHYIKSNNERTEMT